jgi:outer membrane protein assembly factor BamA
MVKSLTPFRTYLVFIALLMSQGLVSMAQTKHPGNGDSLHNAKPKENFYDRNSSSRWIRELKNVIVVPPKDESAVDSFNIESPSNIYIGTEGRIITRIRIVRIKPFGASLTDTSAHDVTWLGKAGNAIHIATNEFIIRNALLFGEGDTVNSFKLADSERYLRSLRYIDDACVVVVPISDNDAEVIVMVQDILPYSVGFGTNFSSRANFALTNRNIIGTGIEVRAGAFIDSQKDRLMGYEAMLRIPNIDRTFISLQADYLDKYENQHYGFTLSRDFHTPTTQYAGHLILYNARTPVRYSNPEDDYPKVTAVTVRYNHLDVWLGRSFQIDRNPFNKQRKNFTISLGTQRMRFVDRPEKSEESYYKFQNRTTYLASLTYSQQAHYKTNLIYSFGRTEDIPYGYLVSVVGGKEVNEMYNRPYIGANLSSGYFIPKLGYLSSAVSYGTFFRKGTDQGAIDFHLNYFTNLYVLGKFRQRTFINGQYTRQLYNKLDDQLVIDGDFGIPGFRNDSVLGRHRFNLSLEQDLFTPWDLYGFKFVLYVFANFSWLGGYDKPIILSPLYSSFGLGMQIRNNRLIFNTLQIRLAYFPNIPANSKFRYIHLSKETALQPRNFMPKAPDIMPLY